MNADGRLDLAIIGGGMAGLSAGLYAARARLRTTLFDRQGPGGQLLNIERVENYPGFPGGISGFELGPLCAEQATAAGLSIEYREVTSLRRSGARWLVGTDAGAVDAGAVIVATGSNLARLALDGEERLHGRGLSYCASCDAEFFREQDVAVIGGGDSALDETLLLAGVARSVTLVHRHKEFRAARGTQERVLALPGVRVLASHEPTELHGETDLEGVTVRNGETGEMERLQVSGAFVYVGLEPNTSLLDGIVKLDARGHAWVDGEMNTGVPGLYAAGDIRQGSPRLLSSCAGDGTVAAYSVEQYLRSA